MIASVDGASSAGGLSGALGGPADEALFAPLRSLTDVVVVDPGTMCAEGYGPARLAPDPRASLQAGGLPACLPFAVITRSCRLEWLSPFFTEAELMVAGEPYVDLARALAALGDRGAENVLIEGGPNLNAQLLADELIHELCLTVSPTLLADDAGRNIAAAAVYRPVPLLLAHVAEEDDFLFLRHRGGP